MIRPEQFRVFHRKDEHVLSIVIGGQNIRIVTDRTPGEIQKIYDNIQAGIYADEKALYQDVYDRFKDRSVFRAMDA